MLDDIEDYAEVILLHLNNRVEDHEVTAGFVYGSYGRLSTVVIPYGLSKVVSPSKFF